MAPPPGLTGAPVGTFGAPLARLWELLFPERCLGCRKRGQAICDRCRPHIPWLGAETCYRCAKPSPVGCLCGRCRNNHSALDGLRAACAYEGIARQMILDLKYRQARALAKTAAELVVETLAKRAIRADLIAPVPLSAGRRLERGYNQAELIADRVATSIEIPLAPSLLERVRETPPQVGLSAAQRRSNVRDAFVCPNPAAVSGRRILLRDDVATTGATLNACAEPLKVAGAARVFGLVVARD